MTKPLSPRERNAAGRPYPYPPRSILLRLCGLPLNASEDDYHRVWYKEIEPLAQMDELEFRDHLISKIANDENVSPIEAEKRFRKRYPLLYRAILAHEEEAANSRDGNAFHRAFKPRASALSTVKLTTKTAKQVRADFLEAVNDFAARHDLSRSVAEERLLQTEKGRRLWAEWREASNSVKASSSADAAASEKKEAGKAGFLAAVNSEMECGRSRAEAENLVLSTPKGQKFYADWLG